MPTVLLELDTKDYEELMNLSNEASYASGQRYSIRRLAQMALNIGLITECYIVKVINQQRLEKKVNS